MYVYMYLDHKYIAVSYIMYLYMYLDHKYIAIIILLYVNTTLAPNVVSHCAMLQLYLASVYSTIGKVCTLYNNPYNQVGPGTLCIHLCKKNKKINVSKFVDPIIFCVSILNEMNENVNQLLITCELYTISVLQTLIRKLIHV